MSSNYKEILFEEEARNKLLEGIDLLAKVVSKTIGPKGKNIALDGAPTSITSDGASIVNEIEMKDPFSDMGAYFAKQVANKMKDMCGDGTTTATILFASLVKEGMKHLAAGVNPIFLKRGMDKALKYLLEEIEKMSTTIKEEEDIENIASISASNQKDIGKIISEAFQKVGKNGSILIEKGNTTKTSLDLVEGMQHSRGYLSPYFCTNLEKLTVEMQKVKILITDKKISSIQDLLPLLQATTSSGDELLIIADDIEADALATLVVNKLKNVIKVAAIKTPGFGERKKDFLDDLAIFTDATLISEDQGMLLKDVKLENLGEAEKIIITKDKTTIIKGKGEKEKIKERLKQLQIQISKTTSSFEKEKLKERVGKLSGKVATIEIGALSDMEMLRKKQIFEDSYNATQCALEEGVVIGSGACFIHAAKKAKEKIKLKGEEKIGAEILFSSCKAPTRQLLINAEGDASLALKQLDESDDKMGFNVMTHRIEDLFEAGVIDPAKVVKKALQNSVSGAGMVLLTEALITESQEK